MHFCYFPSLFASAIRAHRNEQNIQPQLKSKVEKWLRLQPPEQSGAAGGAGDQEQNAHYPPKFHPAHKPQDVVNSPELIILPYNHLISKKYQYHLTQNHCLG